MKSFFETINLQLRGEARDAVGNMRDINYNDLRDALLSHFSYLNKRDIISSQLENLHQEANESLNEYAERARRLLRDKNLAYNSLSEDQRQEHNRVARRAFSRSIRDLKLRDRLLTRGASSLEDAIAFSIEAKNDSINQIPNGEFYCRHCNIAGHRECDCRKKGTNSGIDQLSNLFRGLTGLSSNNSNSSYQNNSNRFNNRGNWNNNRNNVGNNRNSNPNNNQNWNQSNQGGNLNNSRNSDNNNTNWNQNNNKLCKKNS